MVHVLRAPEHLPRARPELALEEVGERLLDDVADLGEIALADAADLDERGTALGIEPRPVHRRPHEPTGSPASSSSSVMMPEWSSSPLPLTRMRVEQLLHQRGARERHAERSRRLHDQAEVLEVQVDLEARLVRAGDVVRCLLVQAPRAGEAAAQRLERELPVEAGLPRQRERLAERGQVERDDDLVRELGESAGAERAQVGDRLAHGLEHRQRGVEIGLVAADHDRERAVDRPLLPPDTGASSIRTPLSPSARPTFCDTRGEMVDMSRRSSPRRAPSMMPSLPSATSSTSGEFGSIVISTSTCDATSRELEAALAPAPTSSSTGPRLRLCTTRG